MNTTTPYSFRKVTADDLSMLQAWQLNPHVQRWWGNSEPYSEADLADPHTSHWIISIDDHPFAFMQDYSVHGWDHHHFADLPKGARGIDQYIGDPARVGMGHGTAFIKARMQILFNEGTPIIATDPHPDNSHAIATYTKLGFKAAGPPQQTQWGLILPMLAKP